jgi:tetratricopeptide (TPR) repeat protein
MTNSDFDETQPTSPVRGPSGDDNNAEEGLEVTKPTLISEDSALSTENALSDENTATTDSADELPESSKRQSPRWTMITLLGILALVLVAALSAWTGYSSGINLRTEAEITQVAQEADEQFALGISDMQNGAYGRARQRFEYVIELNPNYPGVTDALANVLLMLNATATPSPAPTPSITPTPDTREADEIEALFRQGEQQLANDDWSGAIDTLLAVRKMDASFMMIHVDGMLFLALRNLGIDKIIKHGDLEGGMYDLALAERFGLLDTEAQGFLNWAKLYITGASFWELDWGQAVFYFAQVAPQLPGLRDGSGWTAKERYRLALIGFGDLLLLAGDPCQAMDQYQQSLAIGYDAAAEQSLALAIKGCEGSKPKDQPVEEPPGGSSPGDLPPPSDNPVPTPYPPP